MNKLPSFVASWLTREGVDDFPDQEDLLLWAAGYAHDPVSAWDACPRADFKMAVAGAIDLEREPLLPEVLRAANDVVELTGAPRSSKRAVILALELDFQEMSRAANAVRDLGKRLDRLEEKRLALVKNEIIASVGLVEAAVEVAEDILADRAAGRLDQRASLILEAMKRAGVKKHRKCFEALRRHDAAIHATIAVRSVVVTATACAALRLSEAIDEALSEAEDVTEEVMRDRLKVDEVSATQARAFYVESARVFSEAGRALGLAATADEPRYVAFFATIVEEMVALQGDLVDGSPMLGAWDRVNRAAASLRDDELARRARALSTRIGALDQDNAVEYEDASVTEPIDAAVDLEGDPRAALRKHLKSSVVLFRMMADADALEAAEAALAIVESTGKLDAAALAPALATLEERVTARLARRVAEATTDIERARAEHCLAEVRAIGRPLMATAKERHLLN